MNQIKITASEDLIEKFFPDDCADAMRLMAEELETALIDGEVEDYDNTCRAMGEALCRYMDIAYVDGRLNGFKRGLLPGLCAGLGIGWLLCAIFYSFVVMA